MFDLFGAAHCKPQLNDVRDQKKLRNCWLCLKVTFSALKRANYSYLVMIGIRIRLLAQVSEMACTTLARISSFRFYC